MTCPRIFLGRGKKGVPPFVSNSVQSIAEIDEIDVVSGANGAEVVSTAAEVIAAEERVIVESNEENNYEGEDKKDKKFYREKALLAANKYKQLYRSKFDTPVARTIDLMTTPKRANVGRMRTVLDSIGRDVSWGAVHSWRTGKIRLPDDVSEKWEAWNEERSREHAQIAMALRRDRLAQRTLKRAPEGWRGRRNKDKEIKELDEERFAA